jgi:predicted AlkP superfamily pyrophosphatase or phosphodiesterase
MKKLIKLFFCVVLPACATAHPLRSRPKIVVGIVVDQMRWDYLYRFYDHYSEGGFKRLLREGFNCEQAFINYLPSYTAPGHATIYTGTTPAFHGITGNDWPEKAGSKSVYCCADSLVFSLGGSQSAGRMSPHNMIATTVGDELRLHTNFESKTYGIALKDRGAILPGGHSANGAFWFDDSTGNFISSTYYYKCLPAWVRRFNAQRYPDSLLTMPWELLLPAAAYRQSIKDDNAYEYVMKGEQSPVFPHRFASGDYKAIRRSPAGNQLSFLFAKELIVQEQLGKYNCDLLALSLSATDYVGHAYAPNSIEVEDLYLRLDKQLGSFLRFLDNRFGADEYLVFLTADHGAAHNTEWLQSMRIPAGNLSESDLMKRLNARLTSTYGKVSLIRALMNYQIFLNDTAIASAGLDRDAIKRSLINWCSDERGIQFAVDIEAGSMNILPPQLSYLLLQGYYAPRSGAIALIYEPAWYSDGRKGTTHGTWNPYDRHIPLLWYGKGVRKGSTFTPVQMVDIAVSLAALLHIQMPNAATGKVIPGLISAD